MKRFLLMISMMISIAVTLSFLPQLAFCDSSQKLVDTAQVVHELVQPGGGSAQRLIGQTGKNPVLLPPSNKLITYYPISFNTRDGATSITGHIAVPTGKKGPFPTLIYYWGGSNSARFGYVPGLSLDDAVRGDILFSPLFFRLLEDRLVRMGIAVVFYDKRGVRPNEDFSGVVVDEEVLRTATARNLVSDAFQLYELVKALPQVNSKRISLMGASEGTYLANRIALERPEVVSLLLFGIYTSSMQELLRFQNVDGSLSFFHKIDLDGDRYVDEDEYAQLQEDPLWKKGPSWEDMLHTYDQNNDGLISEGEFRFIVETQHRGLIQAIEAAPPDQLFGNHPAGWFQEYFKEGRILSHRLPLCQKTRVFQGELDNNTPVSDALELKTQCQSKRTPLRSYSDYHGIHHGIGYWIGYRGWKEDTQYAPLRVLEDIVKAAEADLSVP